MIKSIQELIEMKESINKKKNQIKTMYIPSLDMDVKFKVATRSKLIQMRSMEIEEQDPYIIYSHIIDPDLSNKQLQEAYNLGCKPHMIVDKLFSFLEVNKLSIAIAGMDEGDIVKDIKN